MNDLIERLKSLSFSGLNIENKKIIIENGRPTPIIDQVSGSRQFQTSWYSTFDWLCGSVSFNRLFCFPCILFAPKAKQSWTDTGYSNMRNIIPDAQTHAKSQTHLNCYKSWKLFGKINVAESLSQHNKILVQVHNEQVSQNRAHLKHLINATLFLPFRGHDESVDSVNKGN